MVDKLVLRVELEFTDIGQERVYVVQPLLVASVDCIMTGLLGFADCCFPPVILFGLLHIFLQGFQHLLWLLALLLDFIFLDVQNLKNLHSIKNRIVKSNGLIVLPIFLQDLGHDLDNLVILNNAIFLALYGLGRVLPHFLHLFQLGEARVRHFSERLETHIVELDLLLI